MAYNFAMRFLQRSTRYLLSLNRRARRGLAPTNPTPAPRLSRPHNHPFFSSRIPVELSCAESLLGMHSITLSTFLNSLLPSKVVASHYEGLLALPVMPAAFASMELLIVIAISVVVTYLLLMLGMLLMLGLTLLIATWWWDC